MATQDVRLERFLDLAGHELRLPVTALKGQIQLMQRRARRQGASPEQFDDLDRLLYQTERLNYMLQVMLDAFHVAEGGFQLLPSEADYDLADLISRVLMSGRPANTNHTLQFQRLPDEAPIMGNWDRTRIETVMSILLANAIKYSARGEITVTLTCEGQTARIEVSDQGIGVPVADRTRIFEADEHGSNAENHGMGLGLYVARETVKAHGGQIGVKPRKGGGSIFWFTLPLAHLMTLSEQAALASDLAPLPMPASQESAAQKPASARKKAPLSAPKSAPARARTTSRPKPTRGDPH